LRKSQVANNSLGGVYHRIAIRFFDETGKLSSNIAYLFDDKSSQINLSPTPLNLNAGPVRIAYNSELDEFLVTAQRTVFTPKSLKKSKNGIWAQRISYSAGKLGKAAEIIDLG
jgi:hypothetical protein